MKLSQQDADLFFELMWSLQLFVNQRLNLFPKVTTLETYRKLAQSQKARVRKALYSDIKVISDFIEANPQQLSVNNLAIVESWKQFVAGEFFIERLLKKYAIFIQGQKVYGVLALYDSFGDILAQAPLPFYVKAILLPFKGKIIYDGLLESYNIYFGGGISSGIKEIYLTAKQNGTIIESLDAQNQLAQPPRRSSKDWRPEVGELLSRVEKLRASTGEPGIFSPAFNLAKASIELTQAAVDNPGDLDALWDALKKVHRAIKKVETTLDRAER